MNQVKPSSEKKNANTADIRKGIVVFIIFLAIISGIGAYIYHQSQGLNQQYDRVEEAF